MIVITGAAGFISGNFCKKLNRHGVKSIILVDDFTPEKKRKNWETLEYVDKIHREHFFLWAEQNVRYIDFIFHLGARTDYFSTDKEVFDALNVDYSQKIWSFAAMKRIPFIYASSYLTNNISYLYETGERFYPYSEYAKSKYLFDKWLEKQKQTPPFWAGLKFYQVYGINEEHKLENSSNVYAIYKKHIENEAVISAENNIIQDYIYVNDVCKILYYFFNHASQSGIYEVGTGFARPLQAIVDAICKATKSEQKLSIEYPKNEPLVYEADLAKLRKYAYKQEFFSLEQGVKRMIFSAEN